MKLIKAIPPKEGDCTITFFSKRKVYVIDFSYLADTEISIINTILTLDHTIKYSHHVNRRSSIIFKVNDGILLYPNLIELPTYGVKKYKPHEYFEELL
jgi:hypothetical protein